MAVDLFQFSLDPQDSLVLDEDPVIAEEEEDEVSAAACPDVLLSVYNKCVLTV